MIHHNKGNDLIFIVIKLKLIELFTGLIRSGFGLKVDILMVSSVSTSIAINVKIRSGFIFLGEFFNFVKQGRGLQKGSSFYFSSLEVLWQRNELQIVFKGDLGDIVKSERGSWGFLEVEKGENLWRNLL